MICKIRRKLKAIPMSQIVESGSLHCDGQMLENRSRHTTPDKCQNLREHQDHNAQTTGEDTSYVDDKEQMH